MKVRFVGDSCCEFPQDFKEKYECISVPLTIEVGDHVVIDDEGFDQKDFLERVAAYPKCPRSSCPSPEAYMKAYEGEYDLLFVTTLSAELSGSYNSAVLGKKLYEEEHGKRNIHVFNSCSASGGEMQALLKAAEYVEAGFSFEEIVEKTEHFINDELNTFFVLESLEALRKNGRLSRLKTLAATALNIKPVCAGDKGTIVQLALARGMKSALSKMIEISLEKVKNTEERILFINHCNCRKRAEEVLSSYIRKAKFAKTYILDTAGISSLYAGDGGIIVTL
ncbi:MAG: DegV family protein [Lachnospiraceae bacterium]|nr:DegV family protein [Lachnospiraceae bacterium]